MRVLLFVLHVCMLREGDGNSDVGDRGGVVVVSAGHVGGTRGSGLVSSAADVLEMSVNHPAGPHRRLAHKTVNRAPIAGSERFRHNLHGGCNRHNISTAVVVVCPLQPSSSAIPGYPGPERSVPVSS